MATKRYIQRHSFQTRLTHDIVAISCVWLMISGLFVFVPALSTIFGAGFTQFMRISHRVVGVIFIVTPLISAIASPAGVGRLGKKYFTKWTPEDFEFLKKFVPYMLGPKRAHMPDQDEVKSGQRFADGMLILGGLAMAVSGLVLWLGTSVFQAPAEVLGIMRVVHDIFFLVLVVFVIAHVYLGAGVFQPYRGLYRLMFGNGQVAESDALYHWGFWAREEIEESKNIVVKEVPEK